jgi:hypothetical protein
MTKGHLANLNQKNNMRRRNKILLAFLLIAGFIAAIFKRKKQISGWVRRRWKR